MSQVSHRILQFMPALCVFFTKFLARYVHKEIIPNLLDEEDMHIFGLKPMDDPLHLVYCPSCTKVVKASHYATHADLCVVLSSMRDEKVELKSNVERRKPPKKPKAQADVPAPLAIKIYYSQRNNRLRSEIGYMFHAADSQELDYNIKVEEAIKDLIAKEYSIWTEVMYRLEDSNKSANHRLQNPFMRT